MKDEVSAFVDKLKKKKSQNVHSWIPFISFLPPYNMCDEAVVMKDLHDSESFTSKVEQIRTVMVTSWSLTWVLRLDFI